MGKIKSAIKLLLPAWLDDLRPSVRRRAAAERRHQAQIEPLRQAFEALNRQAGPGEIVLRPGIKLAVHPDSRNSFEYFCFRSPDMVREMDSFIENTRDRSALLDIGALHGVFSLAFLSGKPGARALSVDASPLPFAKLLYNIHKNGPARAIPVELALSDRQGSLAMRYEWEHAVATETGDPGGKQLQVEMTTGDLLCEARSFEPDTIKIDVEGHEIHVLRGLKGVLARCRPLIFLEVHPSRFRESDPRADVTELLRDLGYRAAAAGGAEIPLDSLFVPQANSASEQRYVLSAPLVHR